MTDIDNLVRPHLKALKPYSSARDEHQQNQGTFLDANENAFGSVAGGNWNRYPDPYQSNLKSAIAGIRAVSTDKIFLGNGSDEPIDLLIRAFCDPVEDHVLTFPPTYSMYKVSADIYQVSVEELPLNSEFQLDMPSTSNAVSKHPKITFLCSPNNPTGNVLHEADILKIVKSSNGLVVLDEAYIDFAPDKSLLKYVDHYENLVILQTFSKAWGMAAFRLGVAYANPRVIHYLNKIKPPYNISGPVQQSALSALLQFRKKDQWVEQILGEKQRLIERLQEFEAVRIIYPSQANFLLVQFDRANEVYEYLKANRIIVRNRSHMTGCENCLRITVGTPEENDQFLMILEAFS
jgi:histidinol-phosphate aminotransferase